MKTVTAHQFNVGHKPILTMLVYSARSTLAAIPYHRATHSSVLCERSKSNGVVTESALVALS